MTTLFAPAALLPQGWRRDVRVTIAGDRIARVEAAAAPQPQDERLDGRVLLPAMANLHSHAFQRAMAGLAERRGGGEDSFWTWRALMYRFLDLLTPDEVEAIAAQAYLEMLEAGFASVGEFHYLHHQPGGVPYADPAELSRRIMAAAEATGIGLTLLPVLYAQGGAGGAPLEPGQARFGCDLDGFLRLIEAVRPALPPGAVLGAAPHSLRATTPALLDALVAALPAGPLHIHAAEQLREVEEVSAWLGRRPVAFLIERDWFGPRWTVIHATHMTAEETAGLARSGAVAGLCPITEANLGDGIFDGPGFLAAGGLFGIGSDSNVCIDCAGELRMLEYGQRLARRARNVMAKEGASTGASLHAAALRGGARALGRETGAIRAGADADLVALDRTGEVLGHLGEAEILDGWIFAARAGRVSDVWARGKRVVTEGRHVGRDAIAGRFRRVMTGIRARM